MTEDLENKNKNNNGNLKQEVIYLVRDTELANKKPEITKGEPGNSKQITGTSLGTGPLTVGYIKATSDPTGPKIVYKPGDHTFVLIILAITQSMVVTTGLVNILTLNIRVFRNYFYTNLGLTLTILCAIGMALILCVMFSTGCSRRAPWHCPLLFLTLAFACQMTCHITSATRNTIMVNVIIIKALVVSFCILLACTPYDLRKLSVFLFVLTFYTVAVIVIIIVSHVLFDIEYIPTHLLIFIMVSLVISMLTVLELHLIVKGVGIELGAKDFAMGTLMLYTSTVMVLFKCVQLIQKSYTMSRDMSRQFSRRLSESRGRRAIGRVFKRRR